MIEIGPGLGAMTMPLLRHLGQLKVIELDRDLAQRLKVNSGLEVISADVLKVNFTELAAIHKNAKWRVVGNLPYNISSPILFHLLNHINTVIDQHFMLQKEVVDRMVAQPSTAAYGRLSVMLQWRYEMQSCFDVLPEAFNPPPKVVSAVVRMKPKAEFVETDLDQLSELVQVAFSQRRKLLRHTLGKWLEQKDFSGDFNVLRRAEEVSAPEYWNLSKFLQSVDRQRA